MKKLFGRKQKWIAGTLFVKKDDIEQVAKSLIYINTMLGRNDEEDMIELLEATIRNSIGHNSTVCVPVITTERTWKLLKEKSGKYLKLVATTEHRAAKPETTEMGIVLA